MVISDWQIKNPNKYLVENVSRRDIFYVFLVLTLINSINKMRHFHFRITTAIRMIYFGLPRCNMNKIPKLYKSIYVYGNEMC